MMLFLGRLHLLALFATWSVSIGSQAFPLPSEWHALQARANSDDLCGLTLRSMHTKGCEFNRIKLQSFTYNDKGIFGINPLSEKPGAEYHCDHVLELNFLDTLLRDGAAKLGTDKDGLCRRFSAGLAGKLQEVIEGQENLYFMPAKVNLAKHNMMAGGSLDKVETSTRQEVAIVLRTRKSAILKAAGQISKLLLDTTNIQTDDTENKALLEVTSKWEQGLKDKIEEIVQKYPQPSKDKRKASCSPGPDSSPEPDNPRDLTYVGGKGKVPDHDRPSRSKAPKTGKRDSEDACVVPVSSSSNTTSSSGLPLASNSTISRNALQRTSGTYASSSLSRTSLVIPTSATRSGTRPSGTLMDQHNSTSTRAHSLVAQSGRFPMPTSRLATQPYITRATTLRIVKPAATATGVQSVPVAVSATTRSALPPVAAIPTRVSTATIKPQLAPSARLPVPSRLSGATAPKKAAPRILKPSKLAP